MCQLAKFWCQKYILSQLNIFWLVTPWLRTWHIGAWGAVRGSQGKLITPGSFDLQKMIPSLVRKLLLYSEQYLIICFLFNGRWWIVGRVRFLRINISCLTSSLWRSAQKEALKALEDSWKVLDGPMYAVEGLGRSLETKIPHHISIAFSHLSLNPHLHYVWFHKKTKSDKWWRGGVSWYPQKWWRNFLTATKRMNPYSAEWIKIYVVFCVSKALISMIYYMHSHPPRQGVQYKLITSAWLLGCY